MKKPSIKKFTRVLYLLNKLEKGSINLAVEAKELGFSQRTLERDIKEIESAGFPITELSAGRYGMLNGALNRFSLSARDEALLKLMGQLADSLGPQWEESYRRLVGRSVRPEGKEVYFVKMPRMYGAAKPRLISVLEQAVLQHKYINVYYQSGERRVWCNHVRPLKIALFDGLWYLVTLNDYDIYMKFSLGKILKVFSLAEVFKPQNVDDKLIQTPNIWFDMQGNISVKCKVSAYIAQYFKEVEFFPRQTIEKQYKDGSLLLSCKTANFMQVLPQIKRWIPHIWVLSPEGLKEQLAKDLEEYKV